MQKNYFKERTEVRMTALGLSQNDMAELLGVARTRITEALRGDTTPAASNLRIRMDQALSRMADDKRRWMAKQVKDAMGLDETNPDNSEFLATISVILPEDMTYFVTEGGVPIGTWNPVSRTYKALPRVDI